MTYAEFVKERSGYEVFTTLFDDFGIANRFGNDAVKDTFNRVFNEHKTDIRWITELAIVTNDWCWIFYDRSQKESNDKDVQAINKMLALRSKIYADLYYKCRSHAYSGKFSRKDMDYYFQWTD